MRPEKNKEYDAFGPWILIIGEDYALPRLFLPYKSLLDGAILTFKIPRNIERRRANPDMHLYDAVIGIFETSILILNRNDDKVIQTRLKLNHIHAIDNTIQLLHGEVCLYTDYGCIKIEYNAVSEHIIEQAINLIRELSNYPKRALKLRSLDYDVKTIDYLFVNLINREKELDSKIKLVAYQPKLDLHPSKGLFGKIISSFFRKYNLTCTAFLTNGNELIIINRTAPLVEKEDHNYSYSYIYLPIYKIDSVTIGNHAKESSLSELKLKVLKYEFASYFNESNFGIKELTERIQRF
jgi:hypothetical protein